MKAGPSDKKDVNLFRLNAWWGGAFGAVAVVSAAVGFAPAPPNLNFYRTAESQDRILQEVDAPVYAKTQYDAYRQTLSRAHQELQFQKQQFYYVRQYLTFERLSREALESSGDAERVALDTRNSLQRDVTRNRREVRDRVANVRSRLNRVALSNPSRARLIRAEVLLREADMLADSDQWYDANDRVSTALTLTRAAEGEQEERIGRYYDADLMRQWDRWVEQAIDASNRSNSTAVVIVKHQAVCLLFDSGRFVRSFPADLGKNSVFDKNYRGDEATPEGRYHIVKKKGSGQSKYYKALLINYPNEDDIRMYRRMRAAGSLLPRTMLGGSIEIHGGGGRGQNWTEGCVALDNSDMDDIFKRVDVGTSVTIVGNYSDYERLLRTNQKS